MDVAWNAIQMILVKDVCELNPSQMWGYSIMEEVSEETDFNCSNKVNGSTSKIIWYSTAKKN